MTVTSHRQPSQHRARRRAAELTVVAGAAAGGWLLPQLISGSEPAPPLAAQAPVPVTQTGPSVTSIHRVGEVLAASADSITMRATDGQITTFRLTPDTTQVSDPAAPLTVNDHIVVQATVQNGTPVATAVADQDLIGPGGPPQDHDLPVT